MKKFDVKRELKHLYGPSKTKVVQLEVPELRYLMIDGEGAPGSPNYPAAVEALFKVSYVTKFAYKKSEAQTDYGVMPLEGLWWADDMGAFIRDDRAKWKWTMMIMQPDFVPASLIEQCRRQVADDKGIETAKNLRLEHFTEGLCAQTLHVGPFSEEGPTIQRVHDFIAERGALTGLHHEIYLSDIRRAAPEKWRTVLRQPMRAE